ncbi:MAG: DUF2029 domain-containing protein [Rhizobiales bacterium]|nr:DUF2029 domain-containing protein [Hyphomicrobiales bacterium]
MSSPHTYQADPAGETEAAWPSEIWASRISRIIWLACVAAGLALSVYVASKARYSGEDSWLPMNHALKFLHSSSAELVYQKLFFLDHVKFQYPPNALLILDLFNRMGITTNLQLNYINAGLLIATGLVFSVFSAEMLGHIQYRGLSIPIGPIAFLVTLRFYPNYLAFQIGQMQVLLGLLFLLACWALLRSRQVLSGCLIAVVILVKPQLFLLGLLALWQKKWRFVAGFTAILAVTVMLSIGLYGFRNHVDYLNVLAFLSRHGEYQHLNQSVDGILIRWLYHGPSLDRDTHGLIPQSMFPPYIAGAYFATILTSAVMILIPFVIRARGADQFSSLLAFCTASLLFTMASPIAWVHHYNIMLPAYVVALKAIFDRRKGTQAHIYKALLAASFLLTGYPLVPAGDPTVPSQNLLQSHVFIGVLILVGILLREIHASTLSHRTVATSST